MNIIYWCPASDSPAGGVNVIYQHCDILNELGANAEVYHWGHENYKCPWFKNQTRIKRDQFINKITDFSVVPEMSAVEVGEYLKENGARYGIFVQNPLYALCGGIDRNPLRVQEAYLNAELIITISDYSTKFIKYSFPNLNDSKIIQLQPIVDGCRVGEKKKIITYMPRKLSTHGRYIEELFAHKIREDWQLLSLENIDQSRVFEILSESSIFISLSYSEGLGLPPIEAAISGNLVVGYTGEGGKEYFEPPLFNAVAHGDFIALFDALLESIELCDSGFLSTELMRQCVDKTRDRFSKKSGLKQMQIFKDFVDKLGST